MKSLLPIVAVLLLGTGPAPPQGPEPELKFQSRDLGAGVHVLEPIGSASHRLTVAVDGKDALLCDASFAKNADAIRAALKELGVERIRFLVNTHYHSDHTDGNRELGSEAVIISSAATRQDLLRGTAPTPEPPLVRSELPALTFKESMTLHFAEQAVRLIAVPGAHTEGDVVVYFEASRVLHLGDLMLAKGGLPYTGDVDALLEGLDRLLAFLPVEATIVPGHGAPMALSDLRAFRELVKDSRDYVRGGLEEGRSLTQLVDGIPEAWKTWSSRYLSIEDWIRELARMLG